MQTNAVQYKMRRQVLTHSPVHGALLELISSITLTKTQSEDSKLPNTIEKKLRPPTEASNPAHFINSDAEKGAVTGNSTQRCEAWGGIGRNSALQRSGIS